MCCTVRPVLQDAQPYVIARAKKTVMSNPVTSSQDLHALSKSVRRAQKAAGVLQHSGPAVAVRLCLPCPAHLTVSATCCVLANFAPAAVLQLTAAVRVNAAATPGGEERGESAAVSDGRRGTSCARFAGAQHSRRARIVDPAG